MLQAVAVRPCRITSRPAHTFKLRPPASLAKSSLADASTSNSIEWSTTLNMRCLSLLLAICVAAPLGAATQERTDAPPAASVERSYVRESVLAERDFPFLASILRDAPVRELLAQDAVLKAATAERWKSIAQANRVCDGNVLCKSKSLRFTPQQIEAVSGALRRLHGSNASVRDFAHSRLKPAAAEFSLDTSQAENSTIIDAWVRSAP